MKIITVLIIIVSMVAAGFWFYNSQIQQGELKSLAKEMPFEVYWPGYIPGGLSLDKEANIQLAQGTNIGIPQFNLVYESPDAKSSLALRQFDRQRFEADILGLENIASFKDFFEDHQKMGLVSKDGLDIYVKLSDGKVQTFFGDPAYVGTAYLLKEDSLVQINYLGEKEISQEELIKVILSLKK